MSLAIQGMGWVTPLGAKLDDVWTRLCEGQVGEVKPLANPESGRIHYHMPVPPKLVEHLGRAPRLRRSSPISYFAVAAGLSALEDAGLHPASVSETRLAVISAVSSGSVVYTRRFYDQIVKQGANAASPALFPETVYNAPASHLAAQLGINGASYTVVGDNSVGFAALKLAEQLIAAGEADRCLVVGAEELDWILCEAYRSWRFAARQPEFRLHGRPATGAMLAEGAAAVLVGGGAAELAIERIHPGAPHFSRRELAGAVRNVIEDLTAAGRPDLVVGSANGSWTDRSEAQALSSALPCAPAYFPKAALGEALGASALMQVVTAGLALRHGSFPGAAAGSAIEPGERRTVVVASGLNQQAAGAVLSRKPSR